jgi:hypothetical protein
MSLINNVVNAMISSRTESGTHTLSQKRTDTKKMDDERVTKRRKCDVYGERRENDFVSGG